MKSKCKQCGKQIIKTVPWKKFCSQRCKQIAWAVRQSKKVATVLLILFSCGTAFADIPVPAIVDAIYQAEGGDRAKKPFGILSVPCDSYSECRQICENTVRNNYRRWQASDQSVTYLEFLANRYCPVGAENDNGTNKYWLKNVRSILKSKGVEL